MDIQTYFYGCFAVMMRRFTKRSTKRISSGKIPIITADWFGLTIEQEVFNISNQYRGVAGEILIIGRPLTNVVDNTIQMRELWIGCAIEGFLWSPQKFIAPNIQVCWRALRKNNPDRLEEVEKYIYFWEERICTIDNAFLFESCFKFKRKYYHYVAPRPFGSSLSGKIISF